MKIVNDKGKIVKEINYGDIFELTNDEAIDILKVIENLPKDSKYNKNDLLPSVRVKVVKTSYLEDDVGEEININAKELVKNYRKRNKNPNKVRRIKL